jgi:hypothetical protein
VFSRLGPPKTVSVASARISRFAESAAISDRRYDLAALGMPDNASASYCAGSPASAALAAVVDDLQPLHQFCREGRLYDVERWIADGKPLQLSPAAVPKGTRPKTALQIALETGQHSLAVLLLRNGYRLDLERYQPLDKALDARRWDLFDLLLEHGADLKDVDVYTLLSTYNAELYERFRAAGYDLTERHEMAAILGHSTRNRPLLGFVKQHRMADPKIQRELNIALCRQVREGNDRGIALCLWAGADPHAPAPNPELGRPDEPDAEEGEDRFIGWSAIEEAALNGHLEILKRLRPDPSRDDFDHLYQCARYEWIVSYLNTVQPPRDLTSILAWHIGWLVGPFPIGTHRGTGTITAILNCGVRWDDADPVRLGRIRRILLKITDDELKTIVSRLRRPEMCAPETFHELTRSAKLQQRLFALNVIKRPVSERQRAADQRARLMVHYDRATLYEQVWAEPIRDVAKRYGFSDVRLGKICRALRVPVPPRGYWARLRNGYPTRKPALPQLN